MALELSVVADRAFRIGTSQATSVFGWCAGARSTAWLTRRTWRAGPGGGAMRRATQRQGRRARHTAAL